MRAGGRGRLRARLQRQGRGRHTALVPARGVPSRQPAGPLLVPLAGKLPVSCELSELLSQ